MDKLKQILSSSDSTMSHAEPIHDQSNLNETPHYIQQSAPSLAPSTQQYHADYNSKQSTKPLKISKLNQKLQPFDPFQYHDYQNQMKRYSVASSTGGRRFCCGFFASRKSCFLTLASIVLLLLSLVLFGVYYVFPKAPQISFKNPLDSKEAAISTLKFSNPDPVEGILKASSASPFNASMQFQLEFQVFSPNNIEYDFNDLEFSAFLLDAGSLNKTVGNRIGNGSTGKVRFPPQSNTTVKLPFLVQFTLAEPIVSLGGNDQIFSLVRSCAPNLFPGIPAAIKPGQIWFRINGAISSPLVDWTGITPTFSKDVGFPCPASAQDLSKLVQNAMSIINGK